MDIWRVLCTKVWINMRLGWIGIWKGVRASYTLNVILMTLKIEVLRIFNNEGQIEDEL